MNFKGKIICEHVCGVKHCNVTKMPVSKVMYMVKPWFSHNVFENGHVHMVTSKLNTMIFGI